MEALGRAAGVAPAHAYLDDLAAARRLARSRGDERLTAADADALAGPARAALTAALDGRDDVPVARGARLAQAVPLLAAVFPEARFVLVAREPADALADAGLDAAAWSAAAERLLDDLEALPPGRWAVTDRARLLTAPRDELQRLCAFLGLAYDQALLAPLETAQRLAPAAARLRDVVAHGAPAAAPADGHPLRSVSTPSFAATLRALGGSLLVSTYQSHRLVCAREADGRLNTHFRAFTKPMGIAVAPGRFALGTHTEVWDFRDMPAVAPKLDPPGTHDACFLPRRRHVTGDVAIHDLAFAGGELWLAATAFSCLATLDADHSFVPRWTPPFVSAVAPGDRCHLNGLAVADGEVRYVTALGRTDTPEGWRPGKARGGVLLDVPSSEEVAGGLCMPHSPRVHQGRLWLLESGRGALCTVDPATGGVETVAELPGFTRGLAFAGRTAFVGLSQVRESAMFGDLPVTRRSDERRSGVWLVDTETGATGGFLRFDDAVQEISDVAFLPGTRWPEIAEPDSTAVAASYALP